MSTTLIVPDVHEHLTKLQEIEVTLFPKADHIVMLSDFFDTFYERREASVASWIREHVHDDRITMLWGNHDCHYAFTNTAFRCSGFEHKSKIIINSILSTPDWLKFQVYTRVGDFVVSHAGFHPRLKALMDPEMAEEALNAAFNGGFHAMWSPGRAVGGYAPVGGPTWLRWDEEFEAWEQAQIVGHTLGRKVRTRKYLDTTSYCLDTGLRHCILTDGKEVEIVSV